jgi:hypothetical protein
MGVPILVYLASLSNFPLQLMAMTVAGRSVSDILCAQLIGLAQFSFWVMTSLFVANLMGPIGRGAKAILAAIVTSGALLCSLQVTSYNGLGQEYGLHALLGLLSPALVMHHGAGITSGAISNLLQNVGGWSLFSWNFGRSMPSLALVVSVVFFGWSYACWLALTRRFDRPSATLWSKGQSYGITAAVTAFVLGAFRFDLFRYGAQTDQAVVDFMMERGPQGNGLASEHSHHLGNDIIGSLLPLFWLLLPLGLSLVQSRQVLLDGVRRPAVALPESLLPSSSEARSTRQSAHRYDRLWGNQSPPFVALGVHVAIVFTGIALYWGIKLHGVPIALFNKISPEQNSLWGALLLANLWLLLISMVQLIQLRVRRWAGAWSAGAIAIGLFAIPTLTTLTQSLWGGHADHSLWLLAIYPFAALAANGATGTLIAIVGIQWLGLALIYRQFDRSLRSLSRSDLAIALEPIQRITNSDSAS